MFLLKVTLILGLVLVSTSFVSPVDLFLDFSEMDFIHDEVMGFYGGIERTITILKPIREMIVAPVWKKVKHVFGYFYSGIKSGVKKGIKIVLPGSFGDSQPTKPPETFTLQTKTYHRRDVPSNKFLKALNAIERGVADAKAAEKWTRNKQNSAQLDTATENVLNLAVKNRKFQYARHMLGRTLYYMAHSNSNTGRPKRSTRNRAVSFIKNLKKKMGSEKFDELLAVMGDVTLMFAMDTTGSMSDEIETAKKIAIDVINYPRKNPVDYILSPFNDPKTGPVTYKESSEAALFVEAIGELKVYDGGDCPEMTITAILDALDEGPNCGSPMYVFTDASAKDDSKINIETVKELAGVSKTTINFFTTGRHCGDPNYNSFQEIADATSGQVLPLSNNQELQKLNGLIKSAVSEGTNVISAGSNMSKRKKRRAIMDYRYGIKIDDSIEKMFISITTTQPNQGSAITLINPEGVIITSNKTSMSKITIYEVTRPPVGTWSLVIPSGCGNYSYFVRSTSDTNIDLEHYFMQSMPGPVTDVPVSDPLIGRQTKLIITIAGYHKVQKSTVVLELITKYGKHISDVTLTPDKRGMRYVATLTPPSRPFKLKIKGTTKAGNSFERISRNVIEPKHISLRVLHSDKNFTLRRGQQGMVMFHIFNTGAGTKLKIAVKDRLGYTAPMRRSTRTVRRGRWAFFRVTFNVPLNATIGASVTVIVSVTYNNGDGLVMKPVQLLVVA